MPKGIYPRTEQHKKRIGESRKKYFDEHGRVVEIDQRESPEAYREYQRLYQRLWRKRNKHYYRDLKRKKQEEAEDMIIKAEEMTKLKDAQDIWNEIVTSAIANEYNKFEKQTDILPLVEKLHEMLVKYASEVKTEKEKEDEVQ